MGARARSTKADFLLAGLNEQQNKTLRKNRVERDMGLGKAGMLENYWII